MTNCRERWRNIRGAFLRSMRKPPSGSGANSKKPYYLIEHLQFLLPYIKNKASDGNLTGVSDCNETFEVTNSDSEDHTDNQQTPTETQDNDTSHVSTMPNSPAERTDELAEQGQDAGTDKSVIIARKSYNFAERKASASTTSNAADDAFIEWMKTKKERDSCKECPNMSFLRSLLPDMKKMTDKQNRRFRQKVISLIDDILEDADVRASRSSTPYASSLSSLYCQTPSPSDPIRCATTSTLEPINYTLPSFSNALQCSALDPSNHPQSAVSNTSVLSRPWSEERVEEDYSGYSKSLRKNQDMWLE